MHKLFTTIILSLGFICSVVSLSASALRDGEETDIIITEVGNEGSTPIIHAPALIPIQAAYYPSHNTIYVNFLHDLGSVTVEIENETTGAYSQSVINATQGVHPFLISGASGHWTVTFTLSNGVVYYGEFDIIS